MTLPGTGITTTPLGFGCGGLMRTSSRRARQALLGQAYDSGIRHFDVARMYGLGATEAELGRFIKGRRDELVVATKFGIEVAGKNRALIAMQGIARRLISLSPRLRRLARKKSGALYQPRRYDARTARDSLQTSLRELGTDYLDLYLLHEPSLSDLTDPGLVEFLEKAHEDGLIRAYGVAGYPETLLPIADEMPDLTKVLQIPNDIVGRQLRLFNLPQSAVITFSPYSTALERITQHIEASDATLRRWSDATDCDLSDVENVAGFLLKYCLNENSNGVVLFSSGDKRRVASAARLASDFRGGLAVLQAFTRLVEEEIVGARSASPN